MSANIKAVTAEEVEEALEEAMLEKTPVEIAEATMLGDLMHLIVDEFKSAPRVWEEMSEVQQQDLLYRAENQILNAIRKVVAIIAANGHTTIPALLHKITFEKECKAELHPFRRVDDQSMHTLLDAVKKHIFIVVPYDLDNIGEDGKPKADKDQKELELAEAEQEDPAQFEELTPLETARILVDDYVITDAESLLTAFQQDADSDDITLELCEELWETLQNEADAAAE